MVFPAMNEFERWQLEEVTLLRNIVRLVSAWLSEPDDRAMDGTLDRIRELIVQLKQHKQSGRERGWQ